MEESQFIRNVRGTAKLTADFLLFVVAVLDRGQIHSAYIREEEAIRFLESSQKKKNISSPDALPFNDGHTRYLSRASKTVSNMLSYNLKARRFH